MSFPVPDTVLLLAAGILAAGIIVLLVRGRGGHFRALPGWVGFWAFFGALLVCLGRTYLWIGFIILALLMLASLRAFFTLAPVRPGDRWSILASYVAVPCALYPAFTGSTVLFLVMILVMALVLPVLVSFGKAHEGLLDAMGRIVLAVFFFVFCTAHVGLMASRLPEYLELFGILVLAAEFPMRLGGTTRHGRGLAGPIAGFTVGIGTGCGLGYLLAPMVGLDPHVGGIGGILMALAVAAGDRVTTALASALELKASASLTGTGASLDRMVPAVYAAPVFYYFLMYVA
jgi:predicted CDP-diglyceride synthetase/phosphatidate cytidylyltransferase